MAYENSSLQRVENKFWWNAGKIAVASIGLTTGMYINNTYSSRSSQDNQSKSTSIPRTFSYPPTNSDSSIRSDGRIVKQEEMVQKSIVYGMPMMFMAGQLACYGRTNIIIENPIVDRVNTNVFMEGYVEGSNSKYPQVVLIDPYSPSATVPGLQYCVLKNSNNNLLKTGAYYSSILKPGKASDFLSGSIESISRQNVIDNTSSIPVGQRLPQ